MLTMDKMQVIIKMQTANTIQTMDKMLILIKMQNVNKINDLADS
jgi:hypothetical protein